MSMKFLLVAVNAKFIHSNPAVYSLLSFAGEAGREHMEIAEYTINQPVSDILADIYGKKPDVIAFSCYIWNWEIIGKLLPDLHKLLPDVPVWLGGPEVSYGGESVMLRFPSVTGIILGEGEVTCRELLHYYLRRSDDPDGDNDLFPIKRILYRQKEGKLTDTGEREKTDLNHLPFSYGGLLAQNPEDKNMAAENTVANDMTDTGLPDRIRTHFQNRIIYYESSRGCPFRCGYCLSSVDKSLRFKNPAKVTEELTVLLESGVTQVKFVDRTFNCNHAHAMAVWRFIREKDNGITCFHFEIAADIMTEEEIELLQSMRPGLVQLEIGIQSTHQPTLDSVGRNMDFMRVKDVVMALGKNKNIHIHLDLIAGLPYEDYDTFRTSFNETYDCRPEQLQLGFLKVLSGAPIRQQAAEYGIVYEEQPPYQVLFTRWLSYEELRRLHRIEEMVSLYYNSNQFMNTLKVLETAFNSPFQMYEQLADFYHREGYFSVSPARGYRYEVLLHFALAYDEAHADCYRELLTYDLYLRENCKTRPDYALALTPYQDHIWDFYKQEAESRKYLPHYAGYQAKQLIRMTHMEVFTYPVYAEEGKDKMKKMNEPEYILFDYHKKDALTKNAAVRRMNHQDRDIGKEQEEEQEKDQEKERVRAVLKLLDEQYGTELRCFLNHENAWQLLVATILSAQCTDARVNIITKKLFEKYPSIEALAGAGLEELEEDIHSAGFYHNKAKNIIACCRGLLARFAGEVPRSLADLTSLPGVGRKTANVIRGNIFNDPSIVVDTHVKRVSNKLGLTGEEDPDKIEMDLMKVLPEDHWIRYNIQIITLGREICKAPVPKCDGCFLQTYCSYYQKDK